MALFTIMLKLQLEFLGFFASIQDLLEEESSVLRIINLIIKKQKEVIKYSLN